MDNKHRKLFVIKQSKGCKFIPKMYLKSCARTRWGSLYAPTDPLFPMTLTSRGGSEGEGRRPTSEGDVLREERGREFHPQVNASTPSVYTSPQRRWHVPEGRRSTVELTCSQWTTTKCFRQVTYCTELSSDWLRRVTKFSPTTVMRSLLKQVLLVKVRTTKTIFKFNYWSVFNYYIVVFNPVDDLVISQIELTR